MAAILSDDYTRAEFLRDRLIPKAVLFFTGEALTEEDEDVSKTSLLIEAFTKKVDGVPTIMADIILSLSLMMTMAVAMMKEMKVANRVKTTTLRAMYVKSPPPPPLCYTGYVVFLLCTG